MTEVVVFPETLAHVAGYLDAALAAKGYPSARVSHDVYNLNPGPQVWLQRDGGPILDAVREVVRMRVSCFHDDPGKIIDFTNTVSALLMACADGQPVVRATRPAGPVLITPSIKPQTLMSFELTVRGAAL